MRVKLDENPPTALVTVLRELGHDTDTVCSEGLRGEPDDAIWCGAQEAGRFLMTQDLDFGLIERASTRGHPGVLIVRLRDLTPTPVVAAIVDVFDRFPVHSWAGCIVVVTQNKVRVRGPRPRASEGGPPSGLN